jgi:hypothetical protein
VWLSAWPVERPGDWCLSESPQTALELEALRFSVQWGRPLGAESWVRCMVKRFGMEATLRHVGDQEAREKKIMTPFPFQANIHSGYPMSLVNDRQGLSITHLGTR